MAFDRLKEDEEGQASALGAVLSSPLEAAWPSSLGEAWPHAIDRAALRALTAGDERLALALLQLFAEQADLILPILATRDDQAAPLEASHHNALGLTLREAVHRLYGAALAIAASDVADAAAAALSLSEEASRADWQAALALLEARTRALREGLAMVPRL